MLYSWAAVRSRQWSTFTWMGMVLCLFNLSVAQTQRLCNIWLQECTLPWLNRPQIGNDHLSTQPTHHWLHQQKCKTTLASSRWFCVGGAFHASTLPWHTVWNMSFNNDTRLFAIIKNQMNWKVSKETLKYYQGVQQFWQTSLWNVSSAK